MDKISKIISNKFKDSSLNIPLKAAWVCSTLNKKIEGDYLVFSFSKGVVTLVTTDYAEASALKMQKYQLIKKFNSWLSINEIKDIKVVVQS